MKKSIQKLLTLILCFSFCMNFVGIGILAIDESENRGVVFTVSLNPSTLKTSSQDQTVEMTISMSKEETLSDMEYEVTCNQSFSVAQPSSPLSAQPTWNASAKYLLDMAMADVSTNVLGTMVITIPANTVVGDYTIGINNLKLSDSKCEMYTYWAEDVSASATLSITCATHTLTPTQAVTPTCTTPGNKAYYTCSVCQKLFTDENATTETNLTDVTLSATGVHDYQYVTTDETVHYKVCSVCNGEESNSRVNHTYGNWTQTPNSDPKSHSKTCICGKVVTEACAGTDDNDCLTALNCTACGGEITAAGSHTYDDVCDTTCNTCSQTREAPHAYAMTNDATQHWEQCSLCNAKKTDTCVAHTYGETWTPTSGEGVTTHYKTCTEARCGYVQTVDCDSVPSNATCEDIVTCQCGRVVKTADEHVPGASPIYTYKADNQHAYTCTSCNTEILENCSGTDDSNCATAMTCTKCAHELVAAKTHSFGNYITNSTKHWKECGNDGCKVKDSEAEHTYSTVKNDTTNHWNECVCGAKDNVEAHTVTTWTVDSSDTTKHTGTCTNSDCGATVTESHSGGTATCTTLAVCTHCGQSYGAVNLDNHTDLDNDSVCDDCKKQLHVHIYPTDVWVTNATHHWHECTNEEGVCGQKEQPESKAAHTKSDWIETVPASMASTGVKVKKCLVCDYVMETATIDKLPSIADNWYWVVQQLTGRKFSITAIAGEGGSISDEGDSTVKYDRSKKYTITPDEGYEIEAVYVNGEDIGAVETYTFKHVKDDQIIEAVFAKLENDAVIDEVLDEAIDEAIEDIVEEWENPFLDIFPEDDIYDAIRFVNENGLFNGVAPDLFGPELTMTRAMFSTVLGRLAGVDPEAYTDVPFGDVVPGEYYAPYVEWAAENGIVLGYGDGTFGINDEITVEQAVVILARYAEYVEAYEPADEMVLAYCATVEDLADWAVEAMAWALTNEIYEGIDGEISAKTSASRALIAEMLYNYVAE